LGRKKSPKGKVGRRELRREKEKDGLTPLRRGEILSYGGGAFERGDRKGREETIDFCRRGKGGNYCGIYSEIVKRGHGKGNGLLAPIGTNHKFISVIIMKGSKGGEFKKGPSLRGKKKGGKLNILGSTRSLRSYRWKKKNKQLEGAKKRRGPP